MKLLIDGDVLCYRAGFATDKTKYLVTDVNGAGGQSFDDAKTAKEQLSGRRALDVVWSRKETEPEDKALMLVDVMINDVKARYENHHSVVVLSGPTNFRDSIATRTRYKGNRSGTMPPAHLKALRNHLISKGAIVSDREEADDVLAREALADPGSIIVSIDKDLLSVPGRHYNFVSKEETIISAKEATINFYAQVISGDPTDAIPGATGYGPVKARKALEGCKNAWECWQAALGIYHKEFDDISGTLFALECARLVKIGQPKGILWEPPAHPELLRSNKNSGNKQNSQMDAGSGKEQEKSSATE